MKHLTKYALIGLSLLTFSCNNAKETNKSAEAPRPNILVVICDDLGYADLGFNGAKDIKTPALDKLAEQGTICSDAYVVHPFCGPSRAGLMTGVYPHTINSQFNLPPNTEQVYEDQGVPLNETYISKVLKDAGYYTGIVGKWHLGVVEKYHPNQRGFDDFYGFLGGGHEYFPDLYRQKAKRQKDNGNKVIWEYLLPLEHNGQDVHETEYLTDAFSREAVRFINDASKKEDPFFLYLSYNAPHSPMQAKKEDLAEYMNIEDKARRTYAAMVHAVDRGVGNVVNALKENKKFENTLIVFLSDNGGKLKFKANNYPLRGGKGDTYEGGYRTPMFYHWPKHIPAGKVFEHPVSSLDFYPTFAALAGAKVPEGKTLHGHDIYNNLVAGTNPRQGEMIYCMRHRTGYTDVGARRDDWKALKYGNEPWKLINLKEDIGEQKDFSNEHPEILKELVGEAEKWSQTHI